VWGLLAVAGQLTDGAALAEEDGGAAGELSEGW
jgi:hypothetical protein